MMQGRRAAVVAVSLVAIGMAAMAAAQRRVADGVAPRFEVEARGPGAADRWLMGRVRSGGDERDHVWVLQRPRSLTEDEKGATLTPPGHSAVYAPPVMEFDARAQ